MIRLKKVRRSTNSKRVEWTNAPDVKKRAENLISSANLSWVKTKDIYFFRSNNSKTRAFARIWGLSRVWQMALEQKPSYIIEVVSERYDKLVEKQKDRVLLHELAHIPKNFSGALLP